MGKKGMLLVGHGSTMPYNKNLVEKTAEIIRTQDNGFIVRCGFMNINTPSIKDAIKEFAHDPIDTLIVVPLFLAKGVHIEKDIPGEIGLPEGIKKGTIALNGRSIPLVYADPIGSDPLLASLMVKNAQAALKLL
jgi:sirohydrochlorin cobaltochelatase